MRTRDSISRTVTEHSEPSNYTTYPITYAVLIVRPCATKFTLERLTPTKFKATLIRQREDKPEVIINTIEKGQAATIAVLPKISIQVNPDGSIQLPSLWPEDIYHEFTTDGDIYLDGLKSQGKIKLSANRIKVQKLLDVSELELEAVTGLELPELYVNKALLINYQGEESEYQVGKIVSKGTVELNCPNCNIEQLSSIRARGTIRMLGKQITVRDEVISEGGDLILNTTAKEGSYSIVNQGRLQITGNITITGYGFSNEGEFGSGGNISLNVTNLNLQQQLGCNGDFDCVLEGSFTQTKEAKIAVAGSFKLKATQDIITNALIEAKGKLTIENGPEPATLETNGDLISRSVEGIEIITSHFVNRSTWETRRGGMRIYTSTDFAEQHSLNQGEIVCAGNLEIDTLGLHLAAGMVGVDGDFIINSEALALTIEAPCKVGGDIRAYNIRSEQFAYAAEVLQAKGNIDLKFLQGVALQQSINTPGNVTIEVVSKQEVALRQLHQLCPYINLNGSNINAAHHAFPGLTYLNYYLSQGDVKMVQLLVQAGASVTLADNRGVRPRDFLETITNLKLREKLAAVLQSWEQELPTINKTRTEILQELHNFNSNINLNGSNLNGVYQGPGVFNPGMTYLTCYLGRGDATMVQLLVDAGVNTTATDSRGIKPSDMLETIKNEKLCLQLATILQVGARPVAKVASQNLEIMAPIKANGAISLKAPRIMVTATGMLASKTEVTLTSQEATLLGLCRAQQVAIDVTGAFVYTRDSFNAESLIITRTNGFALTTPLNNPGGSLNLTIKSGATADLLVLAPITASQGICISTPNKIKIGQLGQLQQITASTGVLQLEASTIDNSCGQLFGQGVVLQTLGDILNGVHVCGKKPYSVEGLNYEDYFYAGNGAFIASGGDLTVHANAWRNYNAVVYVAGNLKPILQGRLYNQSGQISCGGNADFSRCVLENTFHGFTTSLVYVCYAHTTQPLLSILHTHPTSTRPLVQINGNGVFNAVENQGIINVVAGGRFLQQVIQTTSCSKHEIYVGNYAPSHGLAIHSDYTASINRGWWLGLYRKADYVVHLRSGLVQYGNDYINPQAYPCLITKVTETHQGNLAGGTVSITAPQVTLTGVVSAIQDLSIRDFNKAVIGNSNSLAQLPFKPFNPVIRLLDYEHPGNGLYTETAVGESPTVMKLTVPIPYTPVELPIVVVYPNGFALNHKGLRPLLTQFQEQQNLAQAFIDVTGNSQDAEHTTPRQVYYSCREAAYEALQQYTGTEVESSETSLELLQREHPKLTKPTLVYQEIEYCGTNSREFVLSPLVWFPKSYDNPYVRNGMGLLHGENVYLHGKEKEQSTLYIGGCIQAKETLEASCRDKLTISGTIQGETTTLTSLEGDVEITSRTTRLSKVNGYDDIAIPAEVIAEDTVEIDSRQQDILLQGATTRSGTSTTMHAGHQIIDRPLPLTHYRTQEVHGDRYGTISDTHTEQRVSEHTSGTGTATGKITMDGDFGVTLHAPKFSARNVEITSSNGEVNVLNTTEVHLHEEHLQEDGDGLFSRDKTINSETVTGTSKGAQFDVKELTITGKRGITLKHVISHAETNKFRAPGETISIEQGENESRSYYSEQSKNMAWQKISTSQRHDVTYSPSVFTGVIEIDAATLNLEEVRDTTLDFIQRIVKNNATIKRTTLEEKHEHHEESHSGPSAELHWLPLRLQYGPVGWA